LIVSYADPRKGHHGGIYAGGGWLYVGKTKQAECLYALASSGREIHKRTIDSRDRSLRSAAVKQGILRPVDTWKHKYLMPLDLAMRQQLAPLAIPYPKRCAGGDTKDTPPVQGGEGGSTPTPALQAPQANQ